MIASLQRWLTLGLLLLTLVGTSLALDTGHPGAAVLLLLFFLAGHAAALIMEFMLMRVVNRSDPAPRAPLASVARAWAAEALHGPLVFCWRQPFRSQLFDNVLTPGHRRGVLLVHGFVCNRGLWNRWLQRLRQAQVPVVAVDLEPVFGNIDAYADVIDHGVRQLEAATGLPPIIVAHSMGGLAVRRWRCDPGRAQRVHHLVTLGTPHHGTWLARFALSTNARQMRLGSDWLRHLQSKESPHLARQTTCFFSHTDNIVFPASSATLEGADNRLLTGGVAHVAMVDDERPWQDLLLRLHLPQA
jgi:hypothetical protein